MSISIYKLIKDSKTKRSYLNTDFYKLQLPLDSIPIKPAIPPAVKPAVIQPAVKPPAVIQPAVKPPAVKPPAVVPVTTDYTGTVYDKKGNIIRINDIVKFFINTNPFYAKIINFKNNNRIFALVKINESNEINIYADKLEKSPLPLSKISKFKNFKNKFNDFFKKLTLSYLKNKKTNQIQDIVILNDEEKFNKIEEILKILKKLDYIRVNEYVQNQVNLNYFFLTQDDFEKYASKQDILILEDKFRHGVPLHGFGVGGNKYLFLEYLTLFFLNKKEHDTRKEEIYNRIYNDYKDIDLNLMLKNSENDNYYEKKNKKMEEEYKPTPEEIIRSNKLKDLINLLRKAINERHNIEFLEKVYLNADSQQIIVNSLIEKKIGNIKYYIIFYEKNRLYNDSVPKKIYINLFYIISEENDFFNDFIVYQDVVDNNIKENDIYKNKRFKLFINIDNNSYTRIRLLNFELDPKNKKKISNLEILNDLNINIELEYFLNNLQLEFDKMSNVNTSSKLTKDYINIININNKYYYLSNLNYLDHYPSNSRNIINDIQQKFVNIYGSSFKLHGLQNFLKYFSYDKKVKNKELINYSSNIFIENLINQKILNLGEYEIALTSANNKIKKNDLQMNTIIEFTKYIIYNNGLIYSVILNLTNLLGMTKETMNSGRGGVDFHYLNKSYNFYSQNDIFKNIKSDISNNIYEFFDKFKKNISKGILSLLSTLYISKEKDLGNNKELPNFKEKLITIKEYIMYKIIDQINNYMEQNFEILEEIKNPNEFFWENKYEYVINKYQINQIEFEGKNIIKIKNKNNNNFYNIYYSNLKHTKSQNNIKDFKIPIDIIIEGQNNHLGMDNKILQINIYKYNFINNEHRSDILNYKYIIDKNDNIPYIYEMQSYLWPLPNYKNLKSKILILENDIKNFKY
jgi:hypothetical protein